MSGLKRKLQSSHEEVPKKLPYSEKKLEHLIGQVLKQGLLGSLVVIIHNENENVYVTLQNSFSMLNIPVQVIRDTNDLKKFELKIGGNAYVEGVFQNIQLAKSGLAEKAIEKLKETCFFIYKKTGFVNVTKENLGEVFVQEYRKPAVKNSIAHNIMMKMGWAGGGLGSNEQGEVSVVSLTENINRMGLGTDNLITKITDKIIEFSQTSTLLSLVFDEDFTKEERMVIHKIAGKYNLKSKSTGSVSRKLTVSRKITRMDIVRELLRIGGEDGLYKLQIPSKYLHLWT